MAIQPAKRYEYNERPARAHCVRADDDEECGGILTIGCISRSGRLGGGIHFRLDSFDTQLTHQNSVEDFRTVKGAKPRSIDGRNDLALARSSSFQFCLS